MCVCISDTRHERYCGGRICAARGASGARLIRAPSDIARNKPRWAVGRGVAWDGHAVRRSRAYKLTCAYL